MNEINNSSILVTSSFGCNEDVLNNSLPVELTERSEELSIKSSSNISSMVISNESKLS